jgi:hypothetical protein
MHGNSQIEAGSFALGRLYERVTRDLEATAEELHVTQQDLTQRLGALLLLGTAERTSDPMRDVSLHTSELDQGVRKVAKRGRPRKSGTSVREGRPSKIKSYWMSMTKEERAAEMRRRISKRKAA